jgi:hypothetical protein
MFALGALQFVSDFKRRAREAERAPVYTYDAVEICEVTIDETKVLLDTLVIGATSGHRVDRLLRPIGAG